jgi:1-acyl-sn-glycerol-3-phosphate acyltransferase
VTDHQLEPEAAPSSSRSGGQLPLELDDGPASRERRRAEDESLDQLRVALEGLRREIRSCTLAAEAVEEPDPTFDWVTLFDELRRRLGTLGMVERSAAVDEFGMDAVALDRTRPLLDLLFDRYWRVTMAGAENLPEAPCLLVANRSGLLPYDGLMLSHSVERLLPGGGRPRFLVADWFITLPFIQPYLARLGGVRACRENTDRLLRTGRSVIAFPEGEKGAAKVFRQRYQVQRFGRGGVVRAALDNRVPLVPVGIVGAEEVHPVLFKTNLPARALGLPFIPVTPTFPILGPLGLLPLPTKWLMTIGEPLELEYPDAEEPEDELQVSRLTEQLRSRVQELVSQGLEMRPSVWG